MLDGAQNTQSGGVNRKHVGTQLMQVDGCGSSRNSWKKGETGNGISAKDREHSPYASILSLPRGAQT